MPTRLMLRITAPILLSSFVVLGLGIGTAWYVHRLQRDSSARLARNVSCDQAAQELLLAVRDIRTRMNRFLRNGELRELAEVPNLYTQAERWRGEAERLARTPQEKGLLEQIQGAGHRFMKDFRQAQIQHPESALLEPIRKILERPVFADYLDRAEELRALTQQSALKTSEENQAIVGWTVWGLVLLGTCGAVAGLLTGFGIARAISSRLVQLSVPLRDAAGKLDEVVGPVTVSAGQSFDELQTVLEKLAANVGLVVERLIRSQQQALRAEQLAAVGQLAAGMAHELRNPLTAMKILVQARTESNGTAPLRSRDLAVLEEEITRLERLINSFLDFARPPQLVKCSLDLLTAIEPAIGLVSGRAEQVGVVIRTHMPADPVYVEADTAQMRQLLLNLLLNALDATCDGGIVEVELQAATEDSGEVVLSVSDTGNGLPPQLGDRIFDPFISTKETGIGLGLSICKRIVEAHGGQIQASNRPGGGAVFTVRLPSTSAARKHVSLAPSADEGQPLASARG